MFQKAEPGINQMRQPLDFGGVEFHNSTITEVNTLWTLARER